MNSQVIEGVGVELSVVLTKYTECSSCIIDVLASVDEERSDRAFIHFPMPRSCDATAAPRGMRLLRDEQSYVTVRYRCRRHWAKKQQPRASSSYRKFRENAAPANLAPEASSGTQSNPSRITDDLYTARTHCARCRCGRNS